MSSLAGEEGTVTFSTIEPSSLAPTTRNWSAYILAPIDRAFYSLLSTIAKSSRKDSSSLQLDRLSALTHDLTTVPWLRCGTHTKPSVWIRKVTRNVDRGDNHFLRDHSNIGRPFQYTSDRLSHFGCEHCSTISTPVTSPLSDPPPAHIFWSRFWFMPNGCSLPSRCLVHCGLQSADMTLSTNTHVSTSKVM